MAIEVPNSDQLGPSSHGHYAEERWFMDGEMDSGGRQ